MCLSEHCLLCLKSLSLSNWPLCTAHTVKLSPYCCASETMQENLSEAHRQLEGAGHVTCFSFEFGLMGWCRVSRLTESFVRGVLWDLPAHHPCSNCRLQRSSDQCRWVWWHHYHQLLSAGLVCWCDAVSCLDPSRFQDSWRFCNGFVASEAKTILPHRSRSRWWTLSPATCELKRNI